MPYEIDTYAPWLIHRLSCPILMEGWHNQCQMKVPGINFLQNRKWFSEPGYFMHSLSMIYQLKGTCKIKPNDHQRVLSLSRFAHNKSLYLCQDHLTKQIEGIVLYLTSFDIFQNYPEG